MKKGIPAVGMEMLDFSDATVGSVGCSESSWRTIPCGWGKHDTGRVLLKQCKCTGQHRSKQSTYTDVAPESEFPSNPRQPAQTRQTH